MLEVAPLRVYGYPKPTKNKKGEIVGETIDISGIVKLPNDVLKALGIELRQGKFKKPLLIEIRGDVILLKICKELDHDDIVVGEGDGR